MEQTIQTKDVHPLNRLTKMVCSFSGGHLWVIVAVIKSVTYLQSRVCLLQRTLLLVHLRRCAHRWAFSDVTRLRYIRSRCCAYLKQQLLWVIVSVDGIVELDIDRRPSISGDSSFAVSLRRLVSGVDGARIVFRQWTVRENGVSIQWRGWAERFDRSGRFVVQSATGRCHALRRSARCGGSDGNIRQPDRNCHCYRQAPPQSPAPDADHRKRRRASFYRQPGAVRLDSHRRHQPVGYCRSV